MPITNPTALLSKLIGEDSTNGLPVRRADDQGNLITSVKRVTIVPTAAQTVSGQSGPQQPGFYRELLLFLRVTAVAGTTPTLNVFVDLSDDGGATWFQTAQLGPANISAVPTQPYAATYLLTLAATGPNGAFGDTYRIRWVIAGTTPSFTFQVTAIHK